MSAPPTPGGEGDAAVSIIMLAKVKSLVPVRNLRKGGALARVTLAHEELTRLG